VNRLILPSALALAIALAGCSKNAPGPSLVSSESWCPDGFEIGPQDTCFALPDKHDAETPVLVYLHGMYAGHGSPAEWAVVRSAVGRGFAVIIPRGKRGMCAWKAELKDHFCWPQEVDDPQAFKSVVAEWDRVLWQVDALLEPGTHKRYVLGYSNGGFFATYLMNHDLFPAQGWAIVNGGPLDPGAKPAKPAPALLVAAQDDAAQAPKMKELDETLTRGGIPHVYCPRSGAHELSAEDVGSALRFFTAAAHGKTAAFACEGAKQPAAAASQPAAGPLDTP
jgi:predicted esterase